MKMDAFVQVTANLFAERRLLRLMVFLIGGLTLFNCFLLTEAMNRQRTVIVPVGLVSRASISGSAADTTYLHQMARYAAGLALTFNPATARAQFSELLGLFAPEKFAAAKKALYDSADTVETTKASSVFYIHRMTDHPGQHLIKISGMRVIYVEDKQTEQKTVSYGLTYRIRDGRFWILNFGEERS